MRQCSECHGAVAETRADCPHCGMSSLPPADARKRLSAVDVLMLLTFLSLAYVIGTLAGGKIEGDFIGVVVASAIALKTHPWS